jgi:translation initiation factor 3 subunit C
LLFIGPVNVSPFLTLLNYNFYLDSEDEVRVVKSQKDRKWDSMREGIVRIRNARKNNDWPLIQDEFAAVNKMIEKSKMVILQSGLPNFYVKMLVEVEEHVQAALKDKDAIKKMKPVVSRALNQMKLQVRKHNENYKTEIADCRANPEKYVEAVEESDDSSSDSSSSDGSSESSDSDSDESSASEKPKPKASSAKPAAKVLLFVLFYFIFELLCCGLWRDFGCVVGVAVVFEVL